MNKSVSTPFFSGWRSFSRQRNHFWPLMEMNFEISEVHNIHPNGQPNHILIVTYKHVSILYSTCLLFVTPPRFNKAPENGCLEAYVLFGEGNFSGAMLNFVCVCLSSMISRVYVFSSFTKENLCKSVTPN